MAIRNLARIVLMIGVLQKLMHLLWRIISSNWLDGSMWQTDQSQYHYEFITMAKMS